MFIPRVCLFVCCSSLCCSIWSYCSSHLIQKKGRTRRKMKHLSDSGNENDTEWFITIVTHLSSLRRIEWHVRDATNTPTLGNRTVFFLFFWIEMNLQYFSSFILDLLFSLSLSHSLSAAFYFSLLSLILYCCTRIRDISILNWHGSIENSLWEVFSIE